MDRPVTQRYLELIVVSVQKRMSDDNLQQMLAKAPQCISVHMIHLHEQNQDTSSLQNPLTKARLTVRCIPYIYVKDILLDLSGEIYAWHQEKQLQGAASWLLSNR